MIYLLGMRRFAAILLGVTASACTATAGPVGAQDTPREPLRTIDVTGTATVLRAPDRATVHLAVETLAPTAREARAGNAATMTTVLDAVERLGIDPTAVRTVAVSLSPRYRRGPDVEEPTITGYHAANRVEIGVGVDSVGQVVDAAIDAGANRVTGIQFELSDPEAAYHTALERATARARRDAETIAAALGETLGPVVRASTGSAPSPVSRARTMEAGRIENMPTPVSPGELEVRATVHITFRLGS